MPDGVIIGGWNFVVAAYVVVGGALAIYGLVLWRRFLTARRQSKSNATTKD